MTHSPYAGQLTLAAIEDDEDILIDCEDFESCFNLFGLPAEWHGLFAFEKMVDGSAFDLPKGTMVYPGIRSVPLGWNSAVAVIRAAVRHLVFDLAKVSLASEVSKDKERPAGKGKTVLFLDSFDQLRTVCKS